MADITQVSAAYYEASRLAGLDAARAEKKRLENGAEKAANKKQNIKKNAFLSLLKTESETPREAAFVAGIPADVLQMPYEQAVAALKDALDSAGSALKLNSSLADFAAYKKCVKNFMGYIVAKNYEVEEKEGVQRDIRQKTPVKNAENVSGKKLDKKQRFLIQTIDEKLEKLAAEVMLNHRSKLRLLATIDEINGILVDLMQ